MQDFNYAIEALDQRASGTITVDDYTLLDGIQAVGSIQVTDYNLLIGAQATGTITIDSYALLIEAQATGTITVDSYALLIEAQATGTIQIGDYTALEGKIVTVNGQDYIEGVHWDAITSNDATATNLATAINGAEAVGASATTDTVTVTATTGGTAGNAIALAQDAGTDIVLSGALLTGGQEHAEITVDAVTYVQGTDFTAETSNDVTATNLASAIDAGSQGASATTNVVTVTATAGGSAGNAIDMSQVATAGGATLSGALLTGGQDHATITVDGVALVQGTDFTASVSNDSTATSLASAIDAGAQGASATTNVVTTTAVAVGVQGNARNQLYSGTTGGVTLSGATLSGGLDHGTFTIGADTIVQGTDFTAETNEDTTATNIATAIDLLSGVGASATTDTVTITATAVGVAGNAKVLETNASAGALLSGATLTGGQDAGTFTVGSDTITEGSDFNAETSNDVTAGNIATALEALATVTSSATSAVVTINASTPGVAGNSKVLQTNAASASTLSGATLTGGVAATYTPTFDYSSEENLDEVEANLDVATLAGSSPTLDVTPQISFDKINFNDAATAFAQATGVTNETITNTTTGLYMRFKIVLGGTNSDAIATGTIKAIAT